MCNTKRLSHSLRSWVPPQDSSAKPILGYRLYRDNGMGGAIDNLMATTDENTFSYMDSGLVTGLVYYYRHPAFRISCAVSRWSRSLCLPQHHS